MFNHYPKTPNYGEGLYIRGITFRQESDDLIYAEIEDCNHAFKVSIRHNGEQVTAIDGKAIRTPFDTCYGAIEPLQLLIGTKLNTSLRNLYEQFNTKAQCTHWIDLAFLAISFWQTGEQHTHYRISVPDEKEHGTSVTIEKDQVVLTATKIKQWQVQQPQQYLGNPMLAGFSKWVSNIEDDEEFKVWQMIQKAYFVASARQYDLNKLAGEPAATHKEMMLGACYTYSEPVIDIAKRSHNAVRDFTGDHTQVLKFS